MCCVMIESMRAMRIKMRTHGRAAQAGKAENKFPHTWASLPKTVSEDAITGVITGAHRFRMRKNLDGCPPFPHGSGALRGVAESASSNGSFVCSAGSVADALHHGFVTAFHYELRSPELVVFKNS